MTVLTTGPWVLLGLGVITIIGALVFRIIHPRGGKPWAMYIFGLALVGVGIWGPGFLIPYGGWIGNLSDLIDNPGQQSIAEFVKDVEEGKMPEEIEEIGLNYIVANPVPGVTDSILEGALTRTPSDSRSESILKDALDNLRGRQAAADHLLEISGPSTTSTQGLRQLDPNTREMIFQRAQRLSPQQLQMMSVNLDSIRTLRPPPPVLRKPTG